ncbi:MAG: phosphatidylinositol mannoside acyltransferase [Actinobacteria bacterium]|nr:phosphatidylinositol mannoside acyltransferase [Actinomycetota bacterium]MDA2981769.1 phosphatidylinositol mannoside acyltransferase [Actinomycetota bacterium]MDA2996777.1 phosphatidylinositol mannoside acyltransferase [Actinomycetota bacterium]
MGETFVYWGYNLAWKVIRWIPERKAYSSADRFADFLYARNGKGVIRLRSNYRRVRPELDDAQLEFLVNAGMRSYLRYWCDTFRFPAWSKERLLSTTVCENENYLRDPIAAKRGCIVALPHAGNWDHAGAYFCATGIPLTTVAEHLKPEKLFRKFLEYRTEIGMEVLDLDSRSIAVLSQRLRAGKLVALVADRDLSKNGIPVNFFGTGGQMPAGPALLAIQTGADLITAFVKYEEVGIRIIFGEAIAVPETGSVSEKAAAMTQVFADRFAEQLAVNTVDWHMLQRIWRDHANA